MLTKYNQYRDKQAKAAANEQETAAGPSRSMKSTNLSQKRTVFTPPALNLQKRLPVTHHML